MKKLFKIMVVATILFSAASCGVDIEKLEQNVKASMEETVSERLNLFGGSNTSGADSLIVIKDVSLIRVEGSNYKGIVDMTIMGFPVSKGITVIYRDDRILWEIEK